MFWKKKDDYERDKRGHIVERDENGTRIVRVPSYRHKVETIYHRSDYVGNPNELVGHRKNLETMIQVREKDGFELVSTEVYEVEREGEKWFNTTLFFKRPDPPNQQYVEVVSDRTREDVNSLLYNWLER